MGDATALLRPKVNFGEWLKVGGLPVEGERTKRTVDGDLLRQVGSIIDGLILISIEQRTAVDFIAKRSEVFPHYVSAIRALGELAQIVLSKRSIECLSVESFSEMEADFRNLGPSAFGLDLTERGMFTVWTLRKIHDLAMEIAASPSPNENTKEDADIAMDFVMLILFSRFHVDCLLKSLRSNKPIYPEVVDPIRDGLRATVNAYARIRQWADIRNPKQEPELPNREWTDDDELLLADSMRDMDNELA